VKGIEVSNLSWKAGNHQILKSISFDIENGSSFSLIGPSGGGKTSLLRCIAGLIRNYAGSVTVKGVGVDALPPERRNVVLMRQQGAIFPHLTAVENIAFGLKIRHRNKEEICETTKQFLSMIGLVEKAHYYPAELSAGQCQRIALAMALAVRPAAILLDEPFSNLDPVTAKDMRSVTADLVSSLGITTMLATHDWEDAFLLGNKTALLLNGGLYALNEEGMCESNDETALAFLKGLRVINGTVSGGIFSASGVSFSTALEDGEYRALVQKGAVTILSWRY
jgi:ABC-type Fe3+/spermidine/putrescine transport system ATPase subunit